MQRLDLVTAYKNFTSSNGYGDVFNRLCDYLVEFDPDLVVIINRAIGKVGTGTVTLSVPAPTLTRAQGETGSYSSFPSSTL